MDENESSVNIVEDAPEQSAEVSAQELMEGVQASAGDAQDETGGEKADAAGGEESAVQSESKDGNQEGNAQADQKAQYVEALRGLAQDGWTKAEIDALCADKTVIADLAKGRTLWQAATGYMRRQSAAQPQQAAPKKRGVPTVKTQTTAGAQDGDRLSEKLNSMSDKEFDEFMRRAEEAMMAGRRVRLE